MLAQPEHYLDTLPTGDSTLPPQIWEAVVQQVEQVLYKSATYQQAIGQIGSGHSPQEIHTLLQTTIREAIHLTLKHPKTGCALQKNSPNPPQLAQSPTAPSQRSKERLPKISKKASKVEVAPQEREGYLREIGVALKVARQAQSLSIDELHQKTWVPVYQIRALEEGHFDRLPEDIYVRGFVRRLGNALGLKGDQMAEKIPSLVGQEGLVPCWSRPQPNQGFYLRTTHLYLGYLTLMAGALGGLSWLSQQPVPQPESRANPEANRLSVSSEQIRSHLDPQGRNGQVQARTVNIAPPETMLFAH